MGFALTQAKEVVFDTLSTSRKAVNLARNPAAALVIGWDDNISLQIEGVARRPVGDDLASAKAAYFGEWPDGRARENWPNIAYVVVQPKWIRYSNYSGAPVVEEFTALSAGTWGNPRLFADCPDRVRRLYAGFHAYADWYRRVSSRSLDDPHHFSRWR